MRKKLTPVTLEMKSPDTGRIEIRDTESPLVFRITRNNARTLTVRTRLGKKQVRFTYPKRVSSENLGDARKWAHLVTENCRSGVDPRETERKTQIEVDRSQFGAVVDSFIERHAKRNNRRWDETQRIFDRYVIPQWGERAIRQISRRDVANLLDEIEDGRIKGPRGKRLGGPVMADRTLAAIRKLFNWYAARDDQFFSPVVKGMARTKPKERARKRVLSDNEIRVMWPLLDGLGVFGAVVKMLLLTAQRRDEVASLRRTEIDADGVWIIPAARYKTGHPNIVPLSRSARAVLEMLSQIGESSLVFTTNGRTALSGFSKGKQTLQKRMLEALQKQAAELDQDPEKVPTPPHWTLHDLRRTAKTLMQRAGVRPDISERVLGHAIPGVEGVYDRHDYLEEKRDALEKLAASIDCILDPRANVVKLKRSAG